MQGFTEFLTSFALFWLASYTVLGGIYLIFGKIVAWFNQAYLADKQIQTRECPPELVQRDIRQSLKSLLNISAMLAAGLALRIHGFGVPVAELTWLNGLIWALVSLLLFDAWFYWGHRIIHHRKLYRRIHQWHHRATTPTVWSNNSDTFLDNLLCQSYWFFCFVLLPAPSAILIAHKIYDQITGMIGHAGYEYAPGKFSAKPSPMIGTTFHDQHHSAFNYNFATHFSIWDRMMGTIHPDYDRLITSYPHGSNRDSEK